MARFVELAIRRPQAVLVAAALSMALALFFAARLELRTGLGELLPEDRRSVQVAAAVAERLPTTSTLAVVAEGTDPAALARFVDAIVPRLEAIGPLVGRVEAGRGEALAFFERNALLYASRADLERAAEAARERYAFEVHARAGFLLDEEREPWTTPLDAALDAALDDPRAARSGGRYLDPARGAAVVLVRTPVAPGDLERTRALERAVRDAVGTPPAGVSVALGGNLLTAAETYAQVKDDLASVGATGVALVLTVVLVFFRRLRPVLAMAVAVAVGASWTFGAAELLVGHLNTATGFLFGIVVGNGINFSIILMARYLDARRHEAIAPSLRRAVSESWPATLTAAGAAAVAYGSLAVTEFRGFRHFGLIGGAGMLLCWFATFVVVPPLLVIFERFSPLSARGGASFDRLAQAILRKPRAVLLAASVAAMASFVLAAGYLADPMEYDLRRIDNDPALAPSEARRVAPLLDAIVGRDGQDGVAIAVEDVAQVAPLAEALEARRRASPKPPFSRVVTAFDLLPADQDAKLRLAEELRSILDRARRRGLVPAGQDARLSRLLEVKKLSLADLPEAVMRPFTERDGTRGRLVYILPAKGESVWDGRYLLAWAASFRETALPDGTVVRGSGRSVVFADVLEAIATEAPRATLCSFVLTLVLVVVSFRGRRGAWLVAGAVVLGTTFTLGALAALGSHVDEGRIVVEPLRLNFLSFVALPLTIGIGADYAVNIVRGLEGRDVAAGLTRTGGAVLACSLTTTLGYGALTRSVNGAIRSFGLAAAAGEIACLIVALVVLPAAASCLRSARQGMDLTG